jgi:rare lipoprotein A (peptidoglycan hydrolase)
MGTVVTVTAVSSGRSVTCTVDDRGPFGSPIIDLSPSGFQALAPLGSGVISVHISW